MSSEGLPPDAVETEYMTLAGIRGFVESLGGVLVLEPGPGDGSPEIAWGDSFFYYAPDGVIPRTQPFATVVTKDYPGDERSRLDRPGAFRVNVHVGTTTFRAWIGRHPRAPVGSGRGGGDEVDPSMPDTVFAHPVYGELGWLAVVNPGPRTADAVRDLLREAHRMAKRRVDRRTAAGSAE